ncbi:MAG TPA: OmpA family protein [Xanthobacteraceae bacterium]|nr:OmpA family protein [Xanthobacteraceae bacterium]
MVLSYAKIGGRIACALFIGSLFWPATGTPAAAQQVSADQIINALAPAPTTRGLTGPEAKPLSDKDRAFVEGLRHRTRSLSLEEGEQVVEMSKDWKSIDLEIVFDYNSAKITGKAEAQLNELGEALRSPRLRNAVVVLGGHTDAKGGEVYNQELSDRRAVAVKRYLVEKFNLSPENLTTVGYGKRHLKDPANPLGAENRRVQILNTPSTQASR